MRSHGTTPLSETFTSAQSQRGAFDLRISKCAAIYWITYQIDSDLFRVVYTPAGGVPTIYELSVPEGDRKDTAVVVPLVNGKPIEGDPAMFGSPIVLTEPPVPGGPARVIS